LFINGIIILPVIQDWNVIFPFIQQFFFGSTVVRTQGLTLARQVLYYLSHSTSPFLCVLGTQIGSQELFGQAGFEPQS
jgi:hypothetical protein